MRFGWISIVLLTFLPAFAAKDIYIDFEETKETLLQDEIKSRKIMSTLFDINKKMKNIVAEKAKLEREGFSLESNNAEMAAKILELDGKTKQQKTQLRERLGALYKLGGQGLARIVFSSSDSAQLERNLKILGLIAKRDMDLIKDYLSSLREIEKKKTRLVQRLAHLKKIEKRIAEQEGRLTEEQKSKQKLLSAIKNNKQFALKKLNSLREKTEKSGEFDSASLDYFFRPSFFEKKGELPPPVQSAPLVRFGIWRDPQYKVALSHKGIFYQASGYQASKGLSVRAVFDGVVSFSGELEGYGNTIILDHGDHYYTVYGTNKELKARVGDEVKMGDVIATSGYSQIHQKPGAYFEVRHFSEPTNPSQWLKGMHNEIAQSTIN